MERYDTKVVIRSNKMGYLSLDYFKLSKGIYIPQVEKLLFLEFVSSSSKIIKAGLSCYYNLFDGDKSRVIYEELSGNENDVVNIAGKTKLLGRIISQFDSDISSKVVAELIAKPSSGNFIYGVGEGKFFSNF
ncbi:hypothetical protein HN681_01895 [archaeon]|nr:hypothetical protein [archaeon]MBT3731104.1 hypothetical protein [archaeon]MBT4670217.1 hypothetical protein [archaeon]MBT5030493.1 hypothetical protein [archaeon]MBT5287846.1 hypothetical protein [archaeon]